MAFKFLAPLAGLLLLVAGVQGQAVALGADCDGTTTTCADTATCQTTCKINVGEGCKPDSATELCVDNGECTGAASSETCSCKTGYAGTTTCAVDSGYIGGTCASTADCTAKVTNSVCNSGKKCECDTGYSASGVTACTLGSNTGDSCTSTCSQSTDVCDSSICKIKAGETCTGQTNQCVSNAECAKSSVCVCEAGYKRTTAGKCVSGAAGVAYSMVLLVASVFASSRV